MLVKLRADCDADGDELLSEGGPDGLPTTDGGLSDSMTDSLTAGNSSTDIRERGMGGDRYWFVEAPRGALRTTAGELTELITELPRDTVEAGSVGYGEGEGDVGRDG